MEGFGKKGKDDLMTPRWTEATVRYADAAEHLHVREIITWDRGDIPHPIMSASSGPKAYLRNDIYEVFQISPHVGAHVVVDCESHDIIRRCRSGPGGGIRPRRDLRRWQSCPIHIVWRSFDLDSNRREPGYRPLQFLAVSATTRIGGHPRQIVY